MRFISDKGPPIPIEFYSGGAIQKLQYPWTIWPLKMATDICPETSANNYQSTLRYTPKEGRSENNLFLPYVPPALPILKYFI